MDVLPLVFSHGGKLSWHSLCIQEFLRTLDAFLTTKVLLPGNYLYIYIYIYLFLLVIGVSPTKIQGKFP